MAGSKKKLITADREYCLDVIDLKRSAEITFLELGQYLTRIRREKLWRSGWTSYEEYLDDIKIDRSTASKLERVWSTLVVAYKIHVTRLAQASWSHIAEVLPLIKDQNSAEHWIDYAIEVKDRTDLRRTIHEIRHGTNMLACGHKDTYLLRVCRDCGVRLQEFEDNLKKIHA